MTEWRKCSLHPDVDPERMWGCPDCLVELRQLAQSALAVFESMEQWDDERIRPLVEQLKTTRRE